MVTSMLVTNQFSTHDRRCLSSEFSWFVYFYILQNKPLAYSLDPSETCIPLVHPEFNCFIKYY
jgi:hypothetical protein